MFFSAKAILFDLDGTLIDTTELILRCFDHAWQSVCQITHSRSSLVSTFGIPLPEAMRRLAREARLSNHEGETAEEEELITHLLTTYREYNVANHDLMAGPFEQTREVIAALRSRGYLVGVVTSKARELAVRGLRLCELENLLDVAVFLEDTRQHKPHPEPLLTALGRLRVEPREAVYVGDSAHDLVAGRQAGVKTIAAAWGPFPRAELERENPDFIAESITDLLEIFMGSSQ